MQHVCEKCVELANIPTQSVVSLSLKCPCAVCNKYVVTTYAIEDKDLEILKQVHDNNR